jgi:hypothetical protein
MVLKMVKKFFEEKIKDIELYNEAGLQYELALYLRKELEADILLEYPVTKLHPKETKPVEGKFIKKEIDIFIKHKNERVLIELKFPRANAGFPVQIYNAVKDVKFGVEAINNDKADRFITIFITDHKSVMQKKNTNHIYELFNSDARAIKAIEIDNTYPKFMQDHNHEGGRYESIKFEEKFKIKWVDLDHDEGSFKYYIISSDSKQIEN